MEGIHDRRRTFAFAWQNKVHWGARKCQKVRRSRGLEPASGRAPRRGRGQRPSAASREGQFSSAHSARGPRGGGRWRPSAASREGQFSSAHSARGPQGGGPAAADSSPRHGFGVPTRRPAGLGTQGLRGSPPPTDPRAHRNKNQEMPHSTNKELMLGIVVGTAGISLLALWYHRARKPKTAYSLPRFLSLHKTFDSITLPDEMHNDEETGIIFQKRQLQILEKLNELLTNMEELKEEIRFLKETIPKLEEYIQDGLGGKVMVHKISPQHRARKRKLTTVPSSATRHSSEEAESEGGYITANTDTEEQSFPVPKAFNTHIEELKLDVLLQKVDHLRLNHLSGKMESFELLCDHKEKFKDETEFMWRLVRGYADMYEASTNRQEKKHYANIGKTLGERAVSRAPQNGYCHLWYAVLCGHVSEFEGLQNKINCGYCFKNHLDKAIQLLPDEPFLYYLKGRYCYTVSKLSWIEKKMAATLFGKMPSITVQDAIYNFLKAEELQPGYSVSNYMFLAKCYIDLEETQDAWKFCNSALLLPIITKEDNEAHKEVKKIIVSLKR